MALCMTLLSAQSSVCTCRTLYENFIFMGSDLGFYNQQLASMHIYLWIPIHIHAHSLSCYNIFGRPRSEPHKSSTKLFYIHTLFFSFQRTVVLNVTGAKPTPTQFQTSTVVLWISWKGCSKQLNKVCTLTIA